MPTELFIFVSPHLDDAALSCGGLIKRLTDSGSQVVVATVFTADAPPGIPVSWLARRNQMSWGIETLPLASRRIEDVCAMKTLGADYVHFGLLDAMYRVDKNNNYYYTRNTVNVPAASSDEENCLKLLLEKFKAIQSEYSGKTLRVFCPMGFGGHVDHIIVRKAVEAFWNPDEVIYYEDYPYAGQDGIIEKWTDYEKHPRLWKSFTAKLSADEISARVDSVAEYASQLRGLFPSNVERWLEIGQARLSFLSGVRFPRNHDASRRRAKRSIMQYIENVGGEKYWFAESRESLPGVLAGN